MPERSLRLLWHLGSKERFQFEHGHCTVAICVGTSREAPRGQWVDAPFDRADPSTSFLSRSALTM